MKRVPWYVSGPILAATLLVLGVAERRRRLRAPVEPGARRIARNLIIAGTSAIVTALFHGPITGALTRRVEMRRWGLVQYLKLPPFAAAIIALLMMDYSYYLWHVALHRVPFLWRVHIAHHADLDLDTSTALRFHFAEVLATIPLTCTQILVIGLTPSLLSLWQVWFGLCVLFHHSDVRLPLTWERVISRIVMTPRLHGIHHSIIPEETDSNWSSGLAIWDVLHGTQLLNIPQQAITIGVPAYRAAADVTLPRILAMPFVPQPDPFLLPAGVRPLREFVLVGSTGLAP